MILMNEKSKIEKSESEDWTWKEKLGTFLSTPDEIHTFIDGYYTGFVEWRGTSRPQLPEKEKHYFEGGFLLGVVSKFAVIIYFGNEFIKVFFGC
jgi:hypothetical protein